MIGLDWTRAHAAAERLEHGISPEVEALLLRRFGAEAPARTACRCAAASAPAPHGGVMTLADVPAGRSIEIVCVYEKDPKFLDFLDRRGLRPGVRVRIVRREYDETTTLAVAGRKVYLGKPATSRIWARIVTS